MTTIKRSLYTALRTDGFTALGAWTLAEQCIEAIEATPADRTSTQQHWARLAGRYLTND